MGHVNFFHAERRDSLKYDDFILFINLQYYLYHFKNVDTWSIFSFHIFSTSVPN